MDEFVKIESTIARTAITISIYDLLSFVEIQFCLL